MRADITQPDLIAFYISSVMMVIMAIAFLLLASILYKSAQRDMKRASCGNQPNYGPFRRALISTCTVFNLSLVGTILGSSVLVTSLLISLAQAHNAWALKGVVPFTTMGGAIFESSYCVYSWSRSKSIIRNHGELVYWVLTALAVVDPILFCAPFVSSVLYEEQIVSINLYRITTVAAVTGLFLLDIGLFLCFAYFLLKNPAPMASTGQFSGNSEAANQFRRTEIVAKYGLLSSFLSFAALGILVAGQLFPSLNFYLNLLNACAYTTACWMAVVLLVMKIELEAHSRMEELQRFNKQMIAAMATKQQILDTPVEEAGTQAGPVLDATLLVAHAFNVTVVTQSHHGWKAIIQRVRRMLGVIEAELPVHVGAVARILSLDKNVSDFASELLDCAFDCSSEDGSQFQRTCLQQVSVSFAWLTCVRACVSAEAHPGSDRNDAMFQGKAALLDRVKDHLLEMSPRNLAVPSRQIHSRLISIPTPNSHLIILNTVFTTMLLHSINDPSVSSAWACDSLEECIAYLEGIVSIDKESTVDCRISLHVYWMLGNIKYSAGDFASAQALFSQLLHRYTKQVSDNENPPPYYMNQTACALYHMRQYELALLYIQSALESDQEHLEALFNCSLSYKKLRRVEQEKQMLIQFMKKLITCLQETPPRRLPQDRFLLYATTRLTSLLPVAESSNMLALLLSARHSPANLEIQLRRLYCLTLVQSGKRKLARAQSRILLSRDKLDIVGVLCIGRLAVFGKREDGAVSSNAGVSDPLITGWGDVQLEETNVGEEKFSVSEAVGVLKGVAERLKLREQDGERNVNSGFGAGLEHMWKNAAICQSILIESHMHLSILEYMHGRYQEALMHAQSAYTASSMQRSLRISHNYALLLSRLGNMKEASRIWIQARVNGLAEMHAAVALVKKFWKDVGREMCATSTNGLVRDARKNMGLQQRRQVGAGILDAIAIVVGQLGGVLKGIWLEVNNGQGMEEGDNLYRWMDLSVVRYLSEEGFEMPNINRIIASS
ncbi:hypothetical protein HDU78_009433 [Chytriomyces hyalinus]|nr:hypothetical protein HDU78_009433 [Chytriomyces hyalinus]